MNKSVDFGAGVWGKEGTQKDLHIYQAGKSEVCNTFSGTARGIGKMRVSACPVSSLTRQSVAVTKDWTSDFRV